MQKSPEEKSAILKDAKYARPRYGKNAPPGSAVSPESEHWEFYPPNKPYSEALHRAEVNFKKKKLHDVFEQMVSEKRVKKLGKAYFDDINPLLDEPILEVSPATRGIVFEVDGKEERPALDTPVLLQSSATESPSLESSEDNDTEVELKPMVQIPPTDIESANLEPIQEIRPIPATSPFSGLEEVNVPVEMKPMSEIKLAQNAESLPGIKPMPASSLFSQTQKDLENQGLEGTAAGSRVYESLTESSPETEEGSYKFPFAEIYSEGSDASTITPGKIGRIQLESSPRQTVLASNLLQEDEKLSFEAAAEEKGAIKELPDFLEGELNDATPPERLKKDEPGFFARLGHKISQ